MTSVLVDLWFNKYELKYHSLKNSQAKCGRMEISAKLTLVLACSNNPHVIERQDLHVTSFFHYLTSETTKKNQSCMTYMSIKQTQQRAQNKIDIFKTVLFRFIDCPNGVVRISQKYDRNKTTIRRVNHII